MDLFVLLTYDPRTGPGGAARGLVRNSLELAMQAAEENRHRLRGGEIEEIALSTEDGALTVVARRQHSTDPTVGTPDWESAA